MVQPGETVLVALSGGPDSTAMLHALHTRAGELKISIHAAHFNHCLRGEASEMDAKFASVFARSFDIPIHAERADHFASCSHVSEEDARIARHEFLRRVASSIGAERIAVAHTSDDRAESVLLNVVRGTGIAGLGSIRPVQRNIIRPLIDATRADIEAYIVAHAIPFRVDESNADTSFTRNWVRLELLPLLESRCNPNVRESLGRLAAMAADESELMAYLASSARVSVQHRSALDGGLLADLPRPILRELIRGEIRQAKGDLRDITFEQIEAIADAISADGDFTITLTTGDIFAQRKGNVFHVFRKRPRVSIAPFEIKLAVPGVTRIDSVCVALHAEFVDSPRAERMTLRTVMIDADCVKGTLVARNARPGDRITPFGMTGSKKLQDVFVDKKMPKARRDAAIVVVDEEKVLWVVGVIASEACRVTEKTTRAIRLAAEHDQ